MGLIIIGFFTIIFMISIFIAYNEKIN